MKSIEMVRLSVLSCLFKSTTTADVDSSSKTYGSDKLVDELSKKIKGNLATSAGG